MAATFPLASVARRELAPVFASLRLVPESNVRVPEVKLSEVSERRKERESRPSKVLALVVMQLLEESRKQPAVSLMPLAKEEVAVEVLRRVPPPVIVRPAVVERPAAEIPPAKVEVAVEEELML